LTPYFLLISSDPLFPSYFLPYFLLLISAPAMKDDMQKCLDAGCDAYLTKPIVREKFLETIARYLSASRTPPDSQREAPLPIAAAPGPE
jgi:DNA-binding response OmpR family regulator